MTQEENIFDTISVLENFHTDDATLSLVYKSYSTAVAQSLTIASAWSERSGKGYLFCFPSNVELSASTLVSIVGVEMMNAAKRDQDIQYAKTDFAVIAMMPLAEMFPCK